MDKREYNIQTVLGFGIPFVCENELHVFSKKEEKSSEILAFPDEKIMTVFYRKEYPALFDFWGMDEACFDRDCMVFRFDSFRGNYDN